MNGRRGFSRSENGRWLEVYRHGEFHSEWQRSDGEVYELLEDLVDGDSGKGSDKPKVYPVMGLA